MKRFLFIGLCSLMVIPAYAQIQPTNGTQTYSYAQTRMEQGYNAPNTYQNGPYGTYDAQFAPAPTSPRVYGFYQQDDTPKASDQPTQMMWYPTQQQREAAAYSNYGATGPEQQPDVYNSPVYNSKAVRQKHNIYADFHLGIGGTFGWKHDFDNPVGPIWGIALGTRISPNIRVDAEFNYHTEAKLASEEKKDIKYRQYDFGANIYYDFPVTSNIPIRPFIGGGLWAVKGKANATYQGLKVSSTDSGVRFGVSVAGGITYPINEMFSLIAMARARYIDTNDDLYNLEGLIGLRYHF